jgi:hypothetical protein
MEELKALARTAYHIFQQYQRYLDYEKMGVLTYDPLRKMNIQSLLDKSLSFVGQIITTIPVIRNRYAWTTELSAGHYKLSQFAFAAADLDDYDLTGFYSHIVVASLTLDSISEDITESIDDLKKANRELSETEAIALAYDSLPSVNDYAEQQYTIIILPQANITVNVTNSYSPVEPIKILYCTFAKYYVGRICVGWTFLCIH